MLIASHLIGVCSWSLKAPDFATAIAEARSAGLEHMQLALGNLLFMDEQRRPAEMAALRESRMNFTAGMIGFPGEIYSSIATIRETGGLVPDKDYPARKRLVLSAGQLAAELGIKAISTHVGFIPASNQPAYEVLVGRMREVARPLADLGVELYMETGQESAAELLQFLNDLGAKSVGANFDPANMILYGAGDPIDAVRTLGRHIRHVHVKDARLSAQPGMKWGEEVPFGTGQVNPEAFLAALSTVKYTGPLVIERESGSQRLEDVKTAIRSLRKAAEILGGKPPKTA